VLTRLPIRKLAASPVAPLQTPPRWRSELLMSQGTWPQDVNYLRDTYMDIYAIWEKNQPFTYKTDEQGNRVVDETNDNPEQDKQMYAKTEPLLRELILGMEDVSKQMTMRPDVLRATETAKHHFETAESYGRIGDYSMATVYQSYALMKLAKLLDGLTLQANKETVNRSKLGYGYDTSGEVFNGGGTSGNDRHLWDTGNSPKNDKTVKNPANLLVDAEAETDFPELAKFKHKHIYWPPRTR